MNITVIYVALALLGTVVAGHVSLVVFIKQFFALESVLKRIIEHIGIIMAKLQDFKALAVELATKIETLVAKLKAGGLTEAEEQEVFDDFKKITDGLKDTPPAPTV